MKPKQTEVEVIGTTVYRAPEIVIGIRWDKKIDISECLDGELLFDFDDYHQLTIQERKEHIMLFDKAMGPLSGKLLEMSSIREIVKFGDEYKPPVIQEMSKIQNLTSLVDGDLNISSLVLTMLQIDPACRPTAKELLDSEVMKRLKKLDVVQDGERVQEKVEMENGDEVQEIAEEEKGKNKDRKELLQGAEDGEMELMKDEPKEAKEELTEEEAVWNEESGAREKMELLQGAEAPASPSDRRCRRSPKSLDRRPFVRRLPRLDSGNSRPVDIPPITARPPPAPAHRRNIPVEPQQQRGRERVRRPLRTIENPPEWVERLSKPKRIADPRENTRSRTTSRSSAEHTKNTDRT